MNPIDAATKAVKIASLISDLVDIVEKNAGSAQSIKNYIQGKGPRPDFLNQLPDITKNELEHIRIQALAGRKA